MDQSPAHLMIIAGEESGDMRAAGLVKALKSQIPGLRFSGIGGERCKQQDVELIANVTDLAVIGFAEVARHFARIKRVFDMTVEHAVQTQPDAVILVDYPGFNLRLAKALKAKGFKIFYYVSPQVWAWKASRVKLIQQVVDRMIVLFPFEKEFYEKHGYDRTDFVGHPLVDEARADKGCAQFLKDEGLDSKRHIVCLLPGSREKEITRHLPVMLNAAAKIKLSAPETQFLLLKAKNLNRELFEEIALKFAGLKLLITEDYYNGLNACDVCIVSSGTATLETALLEKPMVVIYKTSWLTYALAKVFVKIKYISLANIVAGKEVALELLQNNASPMRIANAVLNYLRNPSKMQAAARELKIVRSKLGVTGASQRAAKVILTNLHSSGI